LIDKRRWLKADDYADLIAFCQFLPGPASSQVGMGIGLLRAGIPGMLTAWLAFTLPSALLLAAAALGLNAFGGSYDGALHGLLAGVVAVVAHAVLGMGRKLCPDPARITIAIASAITMLLLPQAWMQLTVIASGAVIGLLLPPPPPTASNDEHSPHLSRTTIICGWAILIGLVATPILLSHLGDNQARNPLNVFAVFAQTGCLVFGGGHVVLPMLQLEVVDPGWLNNDQFLTGYALTQTMPGPIFTLSSYLGTSIGLINGTTAALGYGAAALLGIFVPSFGMVAALLPLWHRLRRNTTIRRALLGINAAVVGLLAAALYQPVWSKALAVERPHVAVAIALLTWLLLAVWQRPAWLALAIAALIGAAWPP
ncbi:MAG: chromate efflux transporter, partial [Planctomycetota bacterium]